MRRPSPRFFALVAVFALAAGTAGSFAGALAPPALVVVIVIDQFPGNLLERLESRFSPGGFARLIREGVWYTQAHYTHAATLTGVGHATIATGALPAEHGIPGNDWYDRASDRPVYCVEDSRQHWIGAQEKEGEGTSPRNLTTTTFGDEWLLQTRFSARVVSISLKDRGSILLAGRLGKAFWYDERSGRFVSSDYYYPDGKLPEWVEKLNSSKLSDGFFQKSWDLLLLPSSYDTAPDDRAFEIDLKGLGRTFPHKLGAGLASPGPDFYRVLLHVPQGNEMILAMARSALEAESLGRRGVTDLLLLSLTANDYCGHVFGPESLEYQDITLRTDRQLEAFFQHLDRGIGLDRCWIVLTSDHGATPSPEHLASLGLPVGRIDPDALSRAADEALDAAFGPGDWAAKFLNPGLCLRAEPLARKKVNVEEAERIAARAVSRIPGVAAAFTRSDLARGRAPQNLLSRAALDSFHAERGPDVFIVQEPYWYLYKEMKKYDGMHGSPYAYDTHVPIIVRGPRVAPGRFARRVSPASIAPTICQVLGLSPPPSSPAPVLEEALAMDGARSAGAEDRIEPDTALYSLTTLTPLPGPDGTPPPVPITLERLGGQLLSSPRTAIPIEGGFSGLSIVEGSLGPDGRPLELWTVTDRGPNLVIDKRKDSAGQVFGKDSKLFPTPAYAQSIVRVACEPGRTLRILERVPLERQGKPISGLPSSFPGRPSTETAYGNVSSKSPASTLPPSPTGYDLEGLYVEPLGGGGKRFWTCDEYGPSIQVFDARGRLLSELIPGATPSGDGTPESPAIRPLPALLKHRRSNRGFEGLTGTSRHVFAMVQSPFDSAGGASGEPGHGNSRCRLHRIVKVDKATFECALFAYDHVAEPERHGTTHDEVKIGDITALNDTGQELLVLEYATRKYAHVYRVRITSDTQPLDEAQGVAYEAGRAAYAPVERTLVLDLTAELRSLPVPAKPEGLAFVPPRKLFVLFDNDYGLGSDDADFFELSDLEKRTVLLEVDF